MFLIQLIKKKKKVVNFHKNKSLSKVIIINLLQLPVPNAGANFQTGIIVG
jgi:hypothetical protein